MRKRPLLIVVCMLLLLMLSVGVVLAQQSLRGTSFSVEAEIGRALPSRLIYDPTFERYAVVDAYGQLTLVDAVTYERQHLLYESGNYNDLLFSNDGNWLALAIDTRIELWDANSGQRVAFLDDLSQALRVTGPLAFARDDNLLLFNGIYPAPQALRRRENDTSTVPWLWNLTAARNEGDSTFPRNVEALPFFDYRNGFTLGPQNRIVTALPGRLHVLDAYTSELIHDIPTDRYEQDPLDVWFSVRDEQIYVRPPGQNTLLQVDTDRGLLVEIPLNQALSLNDLENLGGLEFSRDARVIGQEISYENNPLLRVFLGENYRFDRRWRLSPITITLIDILNVPFRDESQLTALLFVYDEFWGRGYFIFNRFGTQQMEISEDGETVLLRRTVGENERVETYDLTSGQPLHSFIPSLRNPSRYSPRTRNRVLTYTAADAQIITDFQRTTLDGTTVDEDLRYSRRFERFFFSPDNTQIVTLSDTEWRLWDIATGEVIERKVLDLFGGIVATSPDGFEYLTRFEIYDRDRDVDVSGMAVYHAGTDERRRVMFDVIPGSRVQDVYYTPSWERFLVVYSVNDFGPYSPGNQVAGYTLDGEKLFFIAGDDLPPASGRRYGWIDERTAYIYGEGTEGEQPDRIFGAEYAPDGVPACLSDVETDLRGDALRRVWWAALRGRDTGEAARLETLVCELATSVDTFDSAQITRLERTELNPTATPIVIAGVPPCLTQRYPADADQFAEDWAAITEGLSESEANLVSTVLCEGFDRNDFGNVRVDATFTMMIDSETGERSIGNFTPPENQRPIAPVLREFERVEERPLGTALLSPNEELIAASSLPGELVVYRIEVGYRNLLAQGTATAAVRYDARNIVGALPTYTPTFAPIGTSRPTLTPTVTLTPPPRAEIADKPQLGEVENLCPSETLYDISNPPPMYNPTGRIIGPASGDFYWAVEPEDGTRYTTEDIPLCDIVFPCSISPDNAWFLMFSNDFIFLQRPDGTDFRVLFDREEDPYVPPEVYWTGPDTLEYEVFVEDSRGRIRRALQRDILGVFPDPEPWIPEITIAGVPATLLARQPAGPLALAAIDYSTGTGLGFEYYIVNIETNEWELFARVTDGDLSVFWHPSGDRFYYRYPQPFDEAPRFYVYEVARDAFGEIGPLPGGTWSPDGRYRAYSTDSRVHPVGVYDSETGLTRNYCLPQTGARLYNGRFNFSPDGRYIALRAPLPEDELEEDVGQHVMVLDVETGTVTDLTTGFGQLLLWAVDPSEEGE